LEGLALVGAFNFFGSGVGFDGKEGIKVIVVVIVRGTVG
jgi:hypothetical protein